MSKQNNSSKRLGRGLSALFKDEPQIIEESSRTNWPPSKKMLEVGTKNISPSHIQARTHFDKQKLDELAKSIARHGIIEPILVREKKPAKNKTEKLYEIIAGERRYRAAKQANLETVPVIVRTEDSKKDAEVMLAENIHRENLTPTEEARAYQQIIFNQKLTQKDLAEIIGKSRSHVANTLRLLKLPDWLQEEVDSGKITAGVVRNLIGLKESEQQKLYEKMIRDGMSAREAEKEVQNKVAATPQKKRKTIVAKKPMASSDLRKLEQIIREQLKTKVLLKPMKNGTGKLEIEYYSYDDLLNLISLLEGKESNRQKTGE